MDTRSATRLAAWYALFALIATLTNLGTQALVVAQLRFDHAIELSILAGTATGLVVKYVLDKRYIFHFESTGLAHDGRLFALYTYMGIVTTAIFWSVEYLFHWIFATDFMRYLGGALGLAVGYYIKYRLDKRFVFVAPSAMRSEPA